MDRLGMATYDARNLKITLTRDGKNAYQSSTLPFKLVNMIGAPASESAESLTAALNQLGGTSVDAKEGGKQTVGRAGNGVGIEQVLPHDGERPLRHDIREDENGA